jgi:hypothetical protein
MEIIERLHTKLYEAELNNKSEYIPKIKERINYLRRKLGLKEI